MKKLNSINTNESLWWGTIIVLIAATGFSAKAIFVKLAYEYHTNAVTLLTLRMLFALPFFAIMAWWSASKSDGAVLTSKELFLVFLMGLAGYYLASLLDFLGLQYISAGLERLILFLYPTFVVLISAIFFHRRIGGHDVVALFLSYIGIALVFWHDLGISHQEKVILGSLLVLGSGISYAVYLVGSGALIHKVGTLRYTAYVSIVSSVAVILQFSLTHPVRELNQPIPVYVYSFVMAIFSTVLPVWWMAEGIKRIGASRAAMIGAVGPILTIGMGYVFLNEPITFIQTIGSALVLAGVVVISIKKRAK